MKLTGLSRAERRAYRKAGGFSADRKAERDKASAQERERRERQERERREQGNFNSGGHNRADLIRRGETPPGEFLGLSVTVLNGEVQAWTTRRRLGPLAGAQAGIADRLTTKGAGSAVAATAVFGIVGMAGVLASGSKPFAYVVFADGTLYQSVLAGKGVAARAQADVVRFNMLASQVLAADCPISQAGPRTFHFLYLDSMCLYSYR